MALWSPKGLRDLREVFVLHFLQFFFAQPGQPWYMAAVWGNVVAIVPCGVIGFIVGDKLGKRALRQVHDKLNLHLQLTEELHHLAHHGVPHPDLKERQRARSVRH